MFKCNFSSFSYSKPCVYDYNPTVDAEKVKAIAIQNLSELSSIDDFSEDKNKIFARQVLPAFEKAIFHKKVLRVNNQTVGFITYQEEKTFIGNYAKIEHLAVDTDNQKKGYGSLLLKSALEHLKENKTDFVNLQTTGKNPIGFYQKHNFKVLEYPDFRYRRVGQLVLNFHESQGSFAFRCLNQIRLRRGQFSAHAHFCTYVIVLMSIFNHLESM